MGVGAIILYFSAWGQCLNIVVLSYIPQYRRAMNKFLLLVIFPVLLVACKSKKTSLASDDETVSVADFKEFFQPLALPYQVTDTIFKHKDPESAAINLKIFTRLVPDSVITKFFGKEVKPKLHAVGRVSVPKNETYLFVKATSGSRRVLYVVCFDKHDNFAAARPVIYADNETGYSGSAGMDGKYTLTVMHQRKGPDGQLLFKRDAYVFNESAGFLLILTESNEAKMKVPPVYNPIDTLSHKHKFTGDYMQDKRNFISVRDGRDASHILFFVHFEKDEGCKGELKGDAKFISANVARFHSNGDPCTVEFSFQTGGVTMKEIDGCGNHRDIKCFFEGYYEKRRSKSPPVKSKN